MLFRSDGLARIIRFQFQLDPYDKNTLFLFCGKRTDRDVYKRQGHSILPAFPPEIASSAGNTHNLRRQVRSARINAQSDNQNRPC